MCCMEEGIQFSLIIVFTLLYVWITHRSALSSYFLLLISCDLVQMLWRKRLNGVHFKFFLDGLGSAAAICVWVRGPQELSPPLQMSNLTEKNAMSQIHTTYCRCDVLFFKVYCFCSKYTNNQHSSQFCTNRKLRSMYAVRLQSYCNFSRDYILMILFCKICLKLSRLCSQSQP